MTEWFEIAQAWLESAHPAILPLGLIFLPLVPFPVSVLFVLIAARYSLPMALIVCAFGLAANQSLAFAMARIFGRPVMEPLLKRFGFTVPRWEGRGARKLVLLVRITPGIPLFIQNYGLGLSGVPYLPYLAYSLPITFAYAVAFVVFGAAVFSGKLGWTLTGILGACAILLAINLWREHYRKKAAERTNPTKNPARTSI